MQVKYGLSLQACTPGPANGLPVYVLAQVAPPSVDLKRRLVSLCGKPPPPSSIPAMYRSPLTSSPVIWTLRMNVPKLLTWTGLLQVAPLSVERVAKRQPSPLPSQGTLKSFQETYMFPKWGEERLLSAQPDSRSSKPFM